jgi:hypothetical protein
MILQYATPIALATDPFTRLGVLLDVVVVQVIFDA